MRMSRICRWLWKTDSYGAGFAHRQSPSPNREVAAWLADCGDAVLRPGHTVSQLREPTSTMELVSVTIVSHFGDS